MSSSRPLPLPFIAPVAGISYRQEVACTVAVGDEVTLRRDPTNPYDAHAIAIEFGEDLLGYLPRAIAQRLVGTGSWRGEVEEVLSGRMVGVRIRVLEENPGCTTARQRRIDNLVSPATATPSPSDIDPVAVRALSGRILGTLVTQSEDCVRVRTGAGEVDYPARLVTISPC